MGLPPANWGGGGVTHMHAMHADGRFGTSVKRLGGQVYQGQLSLPSFRGRYMSRGRTLRSPGGISRALPRALNLGAITAGQWATTVELWQRF